MPLQQSTTVEPQQQADIAYSVQRSNDCEYKAVESNIPQSISASALAIQSRTIGAQ